MTEKKYYVALKCDLSHRMSREIDGIGYFFHSTDEKVKSSKFTKSELAKIMSGAIYKGCILPDGHEFSSDCKPWINPLIELVPVEDGE